MNAKTSTRAALRALRAWRARPTISGMAGSESPALAAVGRAVKESLDRVAAADERAIVSRIEQRRTELRRISESIPVIDYGAGGAHAHRSAEEMRRGVESTASVSTIAGASKPPFWAYMLFRMIRHLRPVSCLELGTCVGISASYQASALKLNGSGQLITLEGSPEIAKLARETLAQLELTNATVVTGPFYQTLPGALESAAPIDFLFNDGHHDHDALLAYFTQALPHLAKEAVIVFDDISWSSGMRQAWREIEDDSRVAATVDLGIIGIALISEDRSGTRHYTVPL